MILLTINEYLRMKKKSFYALTLLVSVMMMGFSACGSDDVLGDEKPTSKDEVKVYFVYTLDTSSGTSMNRAPAKAAKTNAEVFDEFYTKIKSGELVAPSYELTLTEVLPARKASMRLQASTRTTSPIASRRMSGMR